MTFTEPFDLGGTFGGHHPPSCGKQGQLWSNTWLDWGHHFCLVCETTQIRLCVRGWGQRTLCGRVFWTLIPDAGIRGILLASWASWETETWHDSGWDVGSAFQKPRGCLITTQYTCQAQWRGGRWEGSERTGASMLLLLQEQLWLLSVSTPVSTARWKRSSSGLSKAFHSPQRCHRVKNSLSAPLPRGRIWQA